MQGSEEREREREREGGGKGGRGGGREGGWEGLPPYRSLLVHPLAKLSGNFAMAWLQSFDGWISASLPAVQTHSLSRCHGMLTLQAP